MVWATTSLYDGNKKSFETFYKKIDLLEKGKLMGLVVIDLCKWNGMTLWGKKTQKNEKKKESRHKKQTNSESMIFLECF